MSEPTLAAIAAAAAGGVAADPAVVAAPTPAPAAAPAAHTPVQSAAARLASAQEQARAAAAELEAAEADARVTGVERPHLSGSTALELAVLAFPGGVTGAQLTAMAAVARKDDEPGFRAHLLTARAEAAAPATIATASASTTLAKPGAADPERGGRLKAAAEAQNGKAAPKA